VARPKFGPGAGLGGRRRRRIDAPAPTATEPRAGPELGPGHPAAQRGQADETKSLREIGHGG